MPQMSAVPGDSVLSPEKRNDRQPLREPMCANVKEDNISTNGKWKKKNVHKREKLQDEYASPYTSKQNVPQILRMQNKSKKLT